MTDRKEQYQEFLKSDFWIKLSHKKKNLIKKCQYCGNKENLECHHAFYREDWYDTEIDDLMVLCRSCHRNKHEELSKLNLSRSEINARIKEAWPKIVEVCKKKYFYNKRTKSRYVSYNDYAKSKYGEHYQEIVYKT